MGRIKLIGLDMDGTLLNGKKELSAYTERVLRQAIDSGVHVLVATGRPVCGIPDQIRNMPGMRYAITANGARILDLEKGRVIYESLVTTKNAEKILDVFTQYDTLREVYFDGISYISGNELKDLPRYIKDPFMRQYILKTKIPVPDIFQMLLQAGKGTDKVHALFANMDERAKAWEELKDMPDITVSSALRNNIEVNGKDVDKGKGLLHLGELLGIRREEIMACGDGLNDISMLQDAGLGVAMANAGSEVREAADVVTLSNEQDGVARAIEKYVLS